jgi:hypothetical protein
MNAIMRVYSFYVGGVATVPISGEWPLKDAHTAPQAAITRPMQHAAYNLNRAQTVIAYIRSMDKMSSIVVRQVKFKLEPEGHLQGRGCQWYSEQGM